LEGVLSNSKNAAGVGVLVNLTSGAWNSGFGFRVLNRNTTGRSNTESDVKALNYNETFSSTRRVKENITPMSEASKNDLRRRPVTFWYQKE
jgi:hypothetical protein